MKSFKSNSDNIELSISIENNKFSVEWKLICNKAMRINFIKKGTGKKQCCKVIEWFCEVYSKKLPKNVTATKICNELDIK